MILVNTDYITGKKLQTLQMVKGSTIQAKNIGRDILSGLKLLVGGELKDYNKMMSEARAIATKRMVEEAISLGADAVINILILFNIIVGFWCKNIDSIYL